MTTYCYFLALPLEIRLQIYRLVLPYTLKRNSLRSTPPTPSSNVPAPSDNDAAREQHHSPPAPSIPLLHRSNSMTSLLKTIKQPPVHCTLWQRGCTSVLATCRQTHREAAEALYGDNTFSLLVSYDKIQFHYAWQLASGLQPQGRHDVAPTWVEIGYVRMMRSFVLTVEHVDGYTATMKYNCGSAGLVAGLRGQLNKLVRLIRRRSEELPLRSVEVRSVGGATRVRVGDGFEDVLLPERIIEPLRKLSGVQCAKVTNNFGPLVARRMEKAMMADKVPDDASDDDNADNVRHRLQQLKLSQWQNLAEPISPAGFYPIPSARLQGFSEI